MKKPNIRQNFYQGQNVLANNLNTLQDYSDTNSNLLVSELLGSGIVDGFEITHKGGFTVSITKGVAFDKNGNRLILEKDTDVPLTTPISTNEESKLISLGIKLSYIESEPVKDSVDKETPTILTPSVEFITGDTLDEDILLLAVITLGEKAIIDIDNKAKKIMTLEQQVSKTNAFTTTTDDSDTIASVDSDIFDINTDIFNINKKSFADTIRDMVYPINSTYIQFPNESNGQFENSKTPNVLFGGVWEARFNSKGVFFRTEGGYAGEARNGSNGIQSDALEKHRHTTEIGSHFHYYRTSRGLFDWGSRDEWVMKHGSYGDRFNTESTNLGNKTSHHQNEGRSSDETRSTNMLIRIWERIA